jgi:hypothetical protein
MEVSASMEHRTGADPDHDLERSGDELEERIERLDDHIGEARQEARARAEDEDRFEDTEEDDDESSSGDPGTFDDPEELEDEDEE